MAQAAADGCHKSFKRALCWVPHPRSWQAIQRLRAVHDRQFIRWPPHIKLLHPFVDEAALPAAAKRLTEGLRGTTPFKMGLAVAHRRQHKHTTGFLKPSSNAQQLADLQQRVLQLFPAYDNVSARSDSFKLALDVGRWPSGDEARDAMQAHKEDWAGLHVGALCVLQQHSDAEPFSVAYVIPLAQADSASEGDDRTASSASVPQLLDMSYAATVGPLECTRWLYHGAQQAQIPAPATIEAAMKELDDVPATNRTEHWLQPQAVQAVMALPAQGGSKHGANADPMPLNEACFYAPSCYGKAAAVHLAQDASARDRQAASRIQDHGKSSNVASAGCARNQAGDTTTYAWYFAFGANLSEKKFCGSRGIQPIASIAAMLPGYELAFQHRGGFGTVVPLQGGSVCASGLHAVHGTAYLVTVQALAKLTDMEHEYLPTEIPIIGYDSKWRRAVAYITPPERMCAPGLPPTSRYLGLLRDGSSEAGLHPLHTAWLAQHESVDSNARGTGYYSSGIDGAKLTSWPKTQGLGTQDSRSGKGRGGGHRGRSRKRGRGGSSLGGRGAAGERSQPGSPR